MSIFTIGYEGLLQPQLLDLLAANRITTVLDIRAVAASRKAGFSKKLLAGSLHAKGIAYVHDRRLGTPKPGRQAARRGDSAGMAAVFNAHMQSAEAQSGLEDAISLSQRGATCLLCFERAPHDCHRSIVASLIHARTGAAIRHL